MITDGDNPNPRDLTEREQRMFTRVLWFTYGTLFGLVIGGTGMLDGQWHPENLWKPQPVRQR